MADSAAVMLTKVSEEVAEIGQVANDPERAHLREDALYIATLEWITLVAPTEIAEVAAEALKVLSLDFERWAA